MVRDTNLVVFEGDWNDGDILREITFMGDEELEKFKKKFKEIGELYDQYKKEHDFKNYGEFLDWLEEYGEDEIENAEEYINIIHEYFPFEGNSQTGCKWVIMNYLKINADLDSFTFMEI